MDSDLKHLNGRKEASPFERPSDAKSMTLMELEESKEKDAVRNHMSTDSEIDQQNWIGLRSSGQ